MHYNDPRLQVYRPNRLPRWLTSGTTKEECEAQAMAEYMIDTRPDLYNAARGLEESLADMTCVMVKKLPTKNDRGVISRKVSVRNVEPPASVVVHIEAALDALWVLMSEAWATRCQEVTPTVPGEFFASSLD